MIRIVLVLVFTLCLNAIEQKTEISTKYISYNDFDNEAIVFGRTDVDIENEYLPIHVGLEYLYSSEYKERRYVMLNEMFVTKDFEDYGFKFGKIIKQWGELEGFNVGDIYNQKHYLLDPFDKSAKLGSIGLSATKYFDENSLELDIKFYEQDLKYPSYLDPYNPFDMQYSKELNLSNKRYTPSVYVIYNFISDESIDSDSKLIFNHGYDNKRYFVPIDQATLSQYAYRVNKLIYMTNIVYDDTIFKCEMAYTDVIKDELMSDYAQLTFGVEKTLYDLLHADTTLYLEYYNYYYKNNEKLQDVDISEIYNNDIFVALRIDFTDVRSSEIKLGILYDLDNRERVFKIRAKSRIYDSFVLSGEFLQIVAKENTVLSYLGNSSRATFGLTYTF